MSYDPKYQGVMDVIQTLPRDRAGAKASAASRDPASPGRLLRVGIATPGQLRARTIAIAKGEILPEPGEPKLWVPSIEALGRIMSAANIAMLATIRDRRPATVKALASLIGRAPSNVLRTLRAMERLGFVRLHAASGRALRPEALFDRVTIDLTLVSPCDAGKPVPGAAAN